MNKVQNGALLVGVAIVLSVIGRLLLPAAHASHNVAFAGFLALLMLVSAAIGLFGLVRLVSGLLTRHR